MFVEPQNLRSQAEKEFILLLGYPSSGKTFSCLSTAHYWQVFYPESKVWIIDTESGVRKVLNEFSDLSNFYYCEAKNSDAAILAVREVKKSGKEGDLVIFESLAKMWELSQSLASEVITGMPRDEWLSKWVKETKGKGGAVPHPDMFWPIAKDAHERQILDQFKEMKKTFHIICTSTIPLGRSPLRDR